MLTPMTKKLTDAELLVLTKDFVLVDVLELQFAMIDGEENLDSDACTQSVKWLFSVIYPSVWLT